MDWDYNINETITGTPGKCISDPDNEPNVEGLAMPLRLDTTCVWIRHG